MTIPPTAEAAPRRWLGPLLRWALLPALLVYVLALLLSRAGGIDDPELVIRDLAQTCGYPLGVGLLSNLGYLLWMATAAICLFTAFSRLGGVAGRPRQLLLAGGAFSLLLCLDDMFLLHDRYISPNVLYLAYALFALLILFRFRPLVLRLGGPVFLVAVLLLGGSLVIDKIQTLLPFAYNDVQLVEEGLKFLGIASWLHFWWRASAGAARLENGRS
jgi:hypothetical protein